MTPDDELEYLAAELERMQDEQPNKTRILRLTDKCLRRCSTWKWKQHGWIISEGQSCGIRNGSERERRTALMSVLKDQIQQVEFVSDLDRLAVVPGPSQSKPS